MLSKLYKFLSILIVMFIGGLGLLLVITAFPIPGNFKAYLVQSGSMTPAIPTGSLVFVMPSANYNVGDVITFGNKGRIPTTHRIVEIENAEGQTTYSTKGDANDVRDGRDTPQSEIIGKVFLYVPYLGYVVDLAKQPLGFAVLVLMPALVLIYDELKKIWLEIGVMRKRKEETNGEL
jgi:signal peptidase